MLPLALAVIMASLGLSLTPGDFRRVIVFPRGVAIGLTNLVLLSPLLAVLVATAYALSPAFAVGLVILGASPGGVMANMLTHLSRGDTALAVTMTAISSLAAVVTVPLFLVLAANHFGAEVDESVNMLPIVGRVLLITVVPLAIGMYLRHRFPERVIALEPRAKRVAFGFFVIAVVGAVSAESERAFANLGALAAATLTLNIAAMTISFTIARLARLDVRQATAIAIELGVHNAALAIAVGAAIDTALTVPAAVYSGFMLITAGIFARAMFHRNLALAAR